VLERAGTTVREELWEAGEEYTGKGRRRFPSRLRLTRLTRLDERLCVTLWYLDLSRLTTKAIVIYKDLNNTLGKEDHQAPGAMLCVEAATARKVDS